MSTSIVVSPAESADIPAIANLFDQYRQFYRQTSNVEAAKEFITTRMQNADSQIFLARIDSAPAGFTQLYPTLSSVSMRRVWVLNDLFVAPEFRKRGAASALMQAAEDFAGQTGAARLSLATEHNNEIAQRLYRQREWIVDETFLHFSKELS